MKKIVCLVLITVMLCSCSGEKEAYEKPSVDILNKFSDYDKESVLKNNIKLINMTYVNNHANEFKYFDTETNDYYIINGTVTNIDYEYKDDSEIGEMRYSITVDDSRYIVTLYTDKDVKLNFSKGDECYFMSAISRLNYSTDKEADLSILALRYYKE